MAAKGKTARCKERQTKMTTRCTEKNNSKENSWGIEVMDDTYEVLAQVLKLTKSLWRDVMGVPRDVMGVPGRCTFIVVQCSKLIYTQPTHGTVVKGPGPNNQTISQTWSVLTPLGLNWHYPKPFEPSYTPPSPQKLTPTRKKKVWNLNM